MTETIRYWLGAAVLPLALVTGACGSAEDPAPALPATDGETLTQAIAAHDTMGTTSEALTLAQLNEVFDGVASYTVLAPTDAAFDALGESGERLLTLEQRPVLVGILREHVLPGHVTPAAIAEAIDAGGGSATMTTLGGGAIGFGLDGETIVTSHSNGAVARVVGDAVESSNGVAIPIDALLAVPDEAAQARAQ